ncbi:GNAT family N-acetyltransferase [Trichormus azollae]|uniref:GNAT family N-acetyltransferase n=1 Tax=Trichormus azollae TaxID=1164 RepID=UPI003D34E40A
MQWTYQEIFPHQDFSHLARTVEQYFSVDTPLWWVYEQAGEQTPGRRGEFTQSPVPSPQSLVPSPQSLVPSPQSPIPSPQSLVPIACLWVGNAIDQVTGSRHAHIFLLYVVPTYRRRGIGTALMRYIENWAKQRGDHQIGLQVFESNTPALNLYHKLSYQIESLWMIRSLQ